MSATHLTPLEQQIAAFIASRADERRVASRVWVFGSRARGASSEFSDLDIAIEFNDAETVENRAWLEDVRVVAEAPVVDQWPGFVNLVGLYASDTDARLAKRVHAEGVLIWQRGDDRAAR